MNFELVRVVSDSKSTFISQPVCSRTFYTAIHINTKSLSLSTVNTQENLWQWAQEPNETQLKTLLLQKSVFNLLLIQLNIFLFSHYNRRTEVPTYLSHIRTEFPPRKMWSLGTAVLARKASAWPEADWVKYLNKSLHHWQPHTATCNTVNYIFSGFTNSWRILVSPFVHG